MKLSEPEPMHRTFFSLSTSGQMLIILSIVIPVEDAVIASVVFDSAINPTAFSINNIPRRNTRNWCQRL